MTVPATSTSGTGSGVWNQIRVPAKVVNVWRDNSGIYCALDDGRVFVGVNAGLGGARWSQYLPAIPDR
jgi:hypothetical protein